MTDNFVPFIDARFHIFNQGRFASNLGLGGRYGAFSGTWALGANVYWDRRESKHLHVNELGVGVEALSQGVDIRLNGYIPSGKTQSGKLLFDRFSGNQILTKQKVFRAIPSIFGEVGVPIPIKALFVDLYMAAGPYYLFERKVCDKKIGDAWGVKGRIENQCFGGFSLAVEASYDHEFGGIVQGVAKWTFPLGAHTLRQDRTYWKIKNKQKECQKRAREDFNLTKPVERNEIIPIDDKNCIAPLIDPLTGEPFTIIFVNNLNARLGIGTFENPYQSLPLAEANSVNGSIIYVFAGDQTTFRMDSGYTFKPNQIMSGSGIPLNVGSITVPAFTPGIFPSVTNTAGDAFKMADGVELAGFNVNSASQDGINVANRTGILIRNNIIQNNTRHGIFSDSSLAEGGNHTITGNTIRNNGGRGIYYNFIGPDNLTITYNTVTENQTNGIDVVGSFFLNSHRVNISNNTVKGNIGNGILVFLSLGEGFAQINDNFVSGNGVHGIFVNRVSDLSGDLGQAQIYRNQLSNQTLDGIRVSTQGRFFADLQKNVATKPIDLITLPGPPAQLCGRLINNVSTGGIVLNNFQASTRMQVEAPSPPSLTSLESINPPSVVAEVGGPLTYVLPGTSCP
ncbi:MAG: right-handed parallel beta-helix repeat-containing protein [Chlamydiia bacterium]|nr:right-handed parallel beta-helix repeat-containing protein [Chlamydiia bacterium]